MFETTTPLIETNLLLLTHFKVEMKNNPLTKKSFYLHSQIKKGKKET
jgi:hypothetical protein